MRHQHRSVWLALPAFGALLALLAAGAANATTHVAEIDTAQTLRGAVAEEPLAAVAVPAPAVTFPPGGTFVSWRLIYWGMGLPWLCVGIGCALAAARARQHRRTLGRLEAIEERLKEMEAAAAAPSPAMYRPGGSPRMMDRAALATNQKPLF